MGRTALPPEPVPLRNAFAALDAALVELRTAAYWAGALPCGSTAAMAERTLRDYANALQMLRAAMRRDHAAADQPQEPQGNGKTPLNPGGEAMTQ